MKLQRILKYLLIQAGLDILPVTWGQWRFIRKFIKRHRVDCIFDVGANEGQFGQELRKIGYKGLIISFEPDPDVFERLRRASSGDPAWVCENIALGSRRDQMVLNRMAASVFNSFLSPTSMFVSDFDIQNSIVSELVVNVERLDELFENYKRMYGFSSPFLKMDTQGFDLEVFDGAAAVISEFVGFQSEIALARIYEGGPTYSTSIDHYVSSGFRIAGVFAVNPHLETVIEIDCYFVPNRD
jgi:FkbM family methyltransferase